MSLKLTRPLLFFDIESTGLSIAYDRIVELCFIKIYPNGNEESQTLRFNPLIPISPDASAVTGITNEDVADCPTFKEKAAELAQIFSGCDIAGYNSNSFDVPLLVEEFLRAGVDFDISKAKLVDVQTIFFKKEPRNLTAAYRFYCDKNLEDAHSALADTRATYEVLKAQLERYDDLEGDVNFLSDFTKRNDNVDLAGRIVYNEQRQEVFNFGKYRGKPVVEVLQRDPGFYAWMMQGDFTQNTKQVLTKLKLRMR
ncbi:MAG: 3'-5' exonuclease [Bacteroidaceae bacterium]|jgi:DNA polymerase-3 subunit epsilon|nr:3'-5' exonuclease [Bacteroidaceae bacterium]